MPISPPSEDVLPVGRRPVPPEPDLSGALRCGVDVVARVQPVHPQAGHVLDVCHGGPSGRAQTEGLAAARVLRVRALLDPGGGVTRAVSGIRVTY
jgi:hypothetical protein